jgi:TolB-like protein/DNA-binding winged helix-turn-helix (wHTH) protein/Tfp pilus assembly protein PilF
VAKDNGAKSLLRFGVFEMDLSTGELRKSGSLVRLSPQPFKVLALLASQPGQLVTREEICRKVWGDSTFVDYEQGLRVAIKTIRAALGDNSQSPRFVETLSRRGYRFIAPVTETGPPNVALGPVANGPASRAAARQIRWRTWALAGAGLVVFSSLFFVINFDGLRVQLADAVDSRLGIRLPRIYSIVVLPFDNLSQRQDQEYFAEGMTDELTTELSQISALRVISRNSAMTYKDSHKPLRQIAKELNVDAVVEGAVQKSGDRVRINVQLVDPQTRRNLWAGSYERNLRDVLDLQGDVAEAIAGRIRVKLTPEQKQRFQAARSVYPPAQEAYLRGRHLFDQRNKGDAPRSTQYFRTAIELDPQYAAAYAGLAESLLFQSYLGVADPEQVMPQARAAARRALSLDPTLGEAYTALGAVEVSYDWNWDSGARNLNRGLELNPSDPFAQIFFAIYLDAQGKVEESVVHARRAVQLDPVSFFANRTLASMLYFARQYDAALAQLQLSAKLQQNHPVIDNWASWVYEKQELRDQAVDADLRALSFANEPAANVDFYRTAYAHGGWRAYWKARIQRMLPRGDNPYAAYALAVSYARLGDSAGAFHWLRRAADKHCLYVVFMKVDPKLDPIRSDPRFQAQLRRLNLPQ